jgi:hypothetical protein
VANKVMEPGDTRLVLAPKKEDIGVRTV